MGKVEYQLWILDNNANWVFEGFYCSKEEAINQWNYRNIKKPQAWRVIEVTLVAEER